MIDGSSSSHASIKCASKTGIRSMPVLRRYNEGRFLREDDPERPILQVGEIDLVYFARGFGGRLHPPQIF